MDIAYVVGLEARGLSPHARRVMESGEVEVCEWTNYALAVRFRRRRWACRSCRRARCSAPTRSAKSAAKVIDCPFTGEKLVALPALYPDVAAIHVHEADRYGNCRIRGTTVADLDLARAAKRLIITCERLIPARRDPPRPDRTVIPFFCVDAVCEVPYGSYPGNMPYEYFSDEEHLRTWLTVEKDLDAFKPFLDEYIFGVAGLRRLPSEMRRPAAPAGTSAQEFLLSTSR